MEWATVWATFSQTHLVTPFRNRHVYVVNKIYNIGNNLIVMTAVSLFSFSILALNVRFPDNLHS
jgi:hypothetical protein